MAQGISLFKTLTKEQISKIAPTINALDIVYSDAEDSYRLNWEMKTERGIDYYSVVDNAGNWTPEAHNTRMEGTIILQNTDMLFGEQGLVSEDTILGIGLIWKSRSSSIRGAKKLGVLSKNDNDSEFSFVIDHPPKTIRGSFELSFNLFIEKEGDGGMLKKGTVIGSFLESVFILEGMGSTFTVLEKAAPGEPLWWVSCSWDEPEYAAFSDAVRVTINTEHPAWILCTDEELKKELLKEIMASTMQIVISELDSNQLNTEDYEPGSVIDAVQYIMGRANLDEESSATISYSIRKYLDKVMK